MKKIAYVGIDYHLETISVAVMVEGEKDFYDEFKMRNEDRLIRRYLKKLSAGFDLRICYEASCSGFSFQRLLKSWGYNCDVIAPSSVPKQSGDRRKNDPRDARNLARHYSQGLLSVVHPQNEEQEAVRNLIRCRICMKQNEKQVKQMINSFLMSLGFSWRKTKWTEEHIIWMMNLEFPDSYSEQILDEYINHLGYLQSRIAYLDKKIESIAASQEYVERVNKLRAFRGVGTFSAMLFISEINDFKRFGHPRALMAFLGLLPSENSSGNRQKGGAITKTGNVRCRTQLIESAQHFMKKPKITSRMKKDLEKVDARSAGIAVACMHRLHKRYWHLAMKGKPGNKAKAAVAREFCGFIWSMMQSEPAAA